MEPLTFKLNESKFKITWKRQLKRVSAIGIPTILISLIAINSSSTLDAISLLLISITGAALIITVLIFGSWLGTKILYKATWTVDGYGISRTLNSATTNIPWSELGIHESSRGELILSDKRINRLIRWWNGAGRIVVPPEMKQFDDFRKILSKVKTSYSIG